MLSAEMFPSVGSGSTLPPAISGASASNSTTISVPLSVRVCQGENFLWRKCDNPGVSIIWFSYNTFFNVRFRLSQPDLDWNRQNSSISDATWCK